MSMVFWFHFQLVCYLHIQKLLVLCVDSSAQKIKQLIKLKYSLHNGRKSLQLYKSVTGSISRIYKELKKVNTKDLDSLIT